MSPCDWYRGTADAIWQNLEALRRHDPHYILVLAGDHIYKQDYARMLYEHAERDADVTVACVEVPVEEAAGQLGVIGVDEEYRIVEFQEKPKKPFEVPGKPGSALGSMGVYVFNADFLYEELERDAANGESGHDFGHDVIPRLVESAARIYAHRLQDSCTQLNEGCPYWRDVGTIDAYYDASMDLIQVDPVFNLYDPDWPLRTYQPQFPPAKFVFDEEGRRGTAAQSLVSMGCIVSGSSVVRSILSPGARVHSFCDVQDSILMQDVTVHRHARIRRAIVDRDVEIPRGALIGYDPAEDRRRHTVSDNGVVVVTPGEECLVDPAQR